MVKTQRRPCFHDECWVRLVVARQNIEVFQCRSLGVNIQVTQVTKQTTQAVGTQKNIHLPNLCDCREIIFRTTHVNLCQKNIRENDILDGSKSYIRGARKCCWAPFVRSFGSDSSAANSTLGQLPPAETRRARKRDAFRKGRGAASKRVGPLLWDHKYAEKRHA